MKKKLWHKIAILAIVFMALEIGLRLIGFGHIPTYYVSTKYEYAMNPNQNLKRFGNRVFINSQGMRSDELREGTIKILKFGDSVLNGGVAIDQSETVSSMLEKDLNEADLSQKKFQVLNVSAGSWGPDNAFAWMKKYGDFDADLIVLVFSSHDWQDQMTFENVVGKTPFYPKKNPALAITDAVYWAYTRVFDTVNWNALEKIDGGIPNSFDHNKGWDDFLAYAERKNIPLMVYHHADREECLEKKYNRMGKALQQFLNAKNVHVISGLNAHLNAGDYRDVIHPNVSGTRKIEEAIKVHVIKTFQQQ